jgi:sulfur carrier protein
MELQINGETRQFDDAQRLTDVLDAMDLDQTEGLAVAVNREVVPRSQWETREMEAGDDVEIIRATQGG